jgi:hypothetical protein
VRKTLAYLYLVVNGLCMLVSLFVTFAFFLGETDFVTYFGLMDPAGEGVNRAGLNFGRVICFFFTAGLFGTLILCWEAVCSQLSAYTNVNTKWEKDARLLQRGEIGADELLKDLTSQATVGSRVRAALDSWQDASPDSDPEYVIEGKAAASRQWLGVLQTLASVLVLIGLVGNFFGLTEAVKTLPKLSGAAVPAPAQSPAETQYQLSKEEGTLKSGKKFEIQQSEKRPPTEKPNSTPDRSELEENVGEISEGLQVVVISSVMGIGSMAILLMLVSMLRGLLNSTISAEVVLLSAEIGTILRPNKGGGFSQELKEGLIALPERLASFDEAATRITETLGRYTADFGEVSKNLDRLLEHQLKDTQEAYKLYHQTLEEFTVVLVDQQGSVTQLTDTTNRLCDNLEGISKSVKSVADQSAGVGDRLNEIQLQYETYLKAATEDIENSRNVVTQLHEKIIDDADERMVRQSDELKEALKNLVTTVSSQTQDGVERLVGELIKELVEATEERQKEMLQQMSSLSEGQLQQYESQLERMETLLEAQKSIQDAAQSSLQQESALSENLAAAAQSLVEAREALSDNRNQLIQVYDELSQNQELALRELVSSWKEAIPDVSENGSGSSVTEEISGTNKRLSEVADQFKELVHTLQNSASLSPPQPQPLPVAPEHKVFSTEGFEQVLNPLTSEAKRLSDAVERLEELLPNLAVNTGPNKVATFELKQPHCLQCRQVNRPGALQCSACYSSSLSTNGLEVLMSLLHQLVDSLDSQHSSQGVTFPTEQLAREIQLQREEVSTHQGQLLTRLTEMSMGLKDALRPEITNVANSVEGLSTRLEAVAREAVRKPSKKRKRETQDLEGTSEKPSPVEQPPSTEPPQTDVEQPEARAEEKKLPFYRRDLLEFFRRKK